MSSLGVAFRALPHYRPQQLVAFLADRAVRAGLTACPASLHHVVGGVASASRPNRELLLRWGRRPEAAVLSPRWSSAAALDPRQGNWSFQGLSRSFPEGVAWEDPALPELWRYSLHYLGPAVATVLRDPGSQGWLADLLADHWRECRPGRGVAWAPFPLAMRLQNLLRTWALLAARVDLEPRLEEQLARHTRTGTLFLAARLEHHLQGNHLLKELAALICGASVWSGLRGLRAAAIRTFLSQAESQFLSGGGHEERSLRYHLDCVQDLLEVRAVLGGEAPARLEELAARALDFAAALEHPDGDIALFNDAELDGWSRRAALSELLGRRAGSWEGLRVFEEEGFVAARVGGSHLAVDCGPLLADHQPAHAHCEALSFELSHAAERWVGNRGTQAYGQGPERLRSRGTAFHSTVQVGRAEQAELWGGFRLGWRPRPQLLEAREDEAGVFIRGAVEWHPSVGAVHERSFRLGRTGDLQLEDEVRFSASPRPVTARLHLPWSLDEGPRCRIAGRGAEVQERPQDWFPRLGMPLPGRVVELRPPSSARVAFKTEVRHPAEVGGD